MPVTGQLFIGARKSAGKARAASTFRAENPATGEQLAPDFSVASTADVDAACKLAWRAFHTYRNSSRAERAAFLRAVGDEIMALGDELLERGSAESGLPPARLATERGRHRRATPTVCRRG